VELVEVLVEEMVAVLAASGGGRKKKKICRGRGKTSRWLPLSPVRIWVRGET
jgi:hypothetical protein